MLRQTCIYCEQEGRETPLLQLDHWGFCPIHSADYLRSIGVQPELIYKTSSASAGS